MDTAGLLRKIARAVGVTSGASGKVGALFMEYKKTRPRGRAWQQERNLLRPFVVRFWRREVSELSVKEWLEHRARRQKTKTRTGKPPRPVTINLELARTKQLFKWGEKNGYGQSPLADCKPIKTRGRRESWFTEAQIWLLLDAADSLRWHHQRRTFRALVTVMVLTGLRISEALSLRWDRITLEGTTAVLGKGSKTRVVGFPPETIEAMRQLDRHPSCPFVFVNYKKGRPYSQPTVRRWFRDAVKAAGLESVKAKGDLALVPHILRHSAASLADQRGAPLQWIQQMLGHSEASTTRVYLHRDDTDQAIRMAHLMSSRRPPRRAKTQSGQILKKDLGNLKRRSVSSFS